MSGAIIGQIAGAAIGFMLPGVGWALGAMIGGVLGGVLFPATVDGPSLDDLKVQSSEYGRPIPIVYGAVAIGGNVIWASEIEVVKGDSGGKGSEPTADAAYGNFAVAICEGVKTLGRIWAGPDKRLIWDGVVLEGADAGATMTFYSGSETQLPDPLIESFEGVGNVEAFRGTAYVVFEHFPLIKDGNRLPFLTIEVGAQADGALTTAPAELGMVWVQSVLDLGTQWVAFFYGSYYGYVVRSFTDYAFVHERVYQREQWNQNGIFSWEPVTERFLQTGSNNTYVSYTLNGGHYESHPVVAPVGADTNPGTTSKGLCMHQGQIVLARSGSPGESNRASLWLVDPATDDCEAVYTGFLPSGYVLANHVLAPADAAATYVIAPATNGATTTLFKLSLASGVAATPFGEVATACGLANDIQVDPNTGYVWSVGQSGTPATVYIRANDPVTETVVFEYSYPFASGYYALPPNGRTPFCFAPGSVTLIGGFGGGHIIDSNRDWLFQFHATTFAVIGAGMSDSACHQGNWYLQGMLWNPVAEEFFGIRRFGTITPEWFVGPSPFNTDRRYFWIDTCVDNPRTFHMGGGDEGSWSSITFGATTLADVVSDLSQRAGLIAGQIDVTQLTDRVDGYAIGNQTTVRDAITALMPAYFFDAVESDGKVKFVKRGGAIAVVIPDDDVGSFAAGSEPPDPIETTRHMENELPRVMNVRYLLEATDYSPAAKAARRLVGSSGEEQTMDLPLVLTDTKAQEIAEVNLHGAWVARLTYSFTLPRKYGYLEPTDIIVVYGYTMRLTKTVNDGGIIKCEAAHDDSNIYTPNVIVTETPAPNVPPPVTPTSATQLELA